MICNFVYFLTSAKNDLNDVIHFDDVIFIMNNVGFSKTYIQSIENHIFFMFTVFYEFLAIKGDLKRKFLLIQINGTVKCYGILFKFL